jgi:hypothetical protein
VVDVQCFFNNTLAQQTHPTLADFDTHTPMVSRQAKSSLIPIRML